MTGANMPDSRQDIRFPLEAAECAFTENKITDVLVRDSLTVNWINLKLSN